MNKKGPAFCANDIASSCVATRARLISRVLSSVYDEAIREYGVKISQVNLLVIIFKLGEAKSPDICRIMKMDASTLSRNVDRMKKKGWLEVKHEDGARSMIVTVTPAGGELLEHIHAKWKEAQRKAVEILDVDGVESIFNISARLWSRE